ncbi:MAG: S-layer homology domain-containing protein, partial [Ruminococcaceae bacterium]|nr:S-layer homology domain-containing protein [Oscillospiraceae bacterium]
GGTISRTEKDPETTTTSKVDKFTDISKEAWYYDYVKAIVEKDFMKGISETEFAPDATLTRGMFVTVLYRIEGEPLVEDGVNFTDVADDQYYANAVKWASANGIVKGITETEFAPNVEVTREQMAAMLTRYADYKKIEAAEGDVSYTDDAEISEYAKEAVKIANKLGILIGNTDGSFAPKKNATRAEAAALFVRLLDVLAK